jgi:hypothetical protein
MGMLGTDTMSGICVSGLSPGRSSVAFRGLYAAICLGALSAGTGFAAGQGKNPADSVTFDIPSQPLISALESYGAASKREVLYDARLATDRVSTEVKGTFAPPEALRILLSGTGLVGRFASETAVVVVPSLPSVAGQRAPTVDTKKDGNPLLRARYYGLVQDRIRDAFCRREALRPGNYRIAVRFWVAPTGAVQQTQLLSRTGDGRMDQAIETTLRELRIGEVPPPGVSQPFTMLVLPRPSEQTRDCAAVDTARYTGEAN